MENSAWARVTNAQCPMPNAQCPKSAGRAPFAPTQGERVLKKGLFIRISQRRLNKLRLLAVEKDKTITQIVEDLIDTLPEPKKSSATEA
jgi:hypothetical protein